MDRFSLITLVLISAVAAPSASAVTIGQIDTFEDGTTQNWVGGIGIGAPHPTPPANALGGAAGAADNYLRLTSVGGAGSGARLSVLNPAQWTGNYIAAGIGSISMDLRNFGQTELALRLVFEDPMFGPPTNVAFSSTPFVLPVGGGWTHAVFPVGVSDLQAGLGNVTTALMNTTTIRLYHSPGVNFPNPVFPIEPIVAALGVDNIQAGAGVAEGGSTAMVFLPVFLAALYFDRRARRA